MVDEVVRCPYCVLGDEFRAMLQRPEWFICEQCGSCSLDGRMGDMLRIEKETPSLLISA